MSSRCGHIRQRRLPCATPECEMTVEPDHLEARVITPPGRRRGWTFGRKNIPEHYTQEITWQRVAAIPSDGLEEGEEPLFLWTPIGDPTPSRKCFTTRTAVHCPVCATYLGNFPFHRRGLSVAVGCPTCEKKLRPRQRDDGYVEWYEAKGPFLGVTPSVLLLEYPE